MDALKTRVEIVDLIVPAFVGCELDERSKLQDLRFDISVTLNAVPSCHSDKLEDTIDYLEIRKLLMNVCASSSFALIERLLWVCVQNMFEAFPLAEEIQCKIKKFSVIPNAKHAGFELIAKRGSK